MSVIHELQLGYLGYLGVGYFYGYGKLWNENSNNCMTVSSDIVVLNYLDLLLCMYCELKKLSGIPKS